MEKIKQTQNRLLEMAKVIHNILEENNIPYIIMYGTLLGAVRHRGFIPWDDDFDIYLFDDEKNSYEKAIEILMKNLPNDMFLEYFNTEPKYFHDWAHVKDKNSICECKEYPQDSLYDHKGISIDLYRAVKMRESEVIKYRNEEYIKYLERRKKYNFISNEDYEKRRKSIVNTVYETQHSQEVYGTAQSLKEMFIDEVFPLKKYKFEDFEFYGPNKYDSMLKRMYGEYEVLPPIEKRKIHYSKVEFI